MINRVVPEGEDDSKHSKKSKWISICTSKVYLSDLVDAICAVCFVFPCFLSGDNPLDLTVGFSTDILLLCGAAMFLTGNSNVLDFILLVFEMKASVPLFSFLHFVNVVKKSAVFVLPSIISVVYFLHTSKAVLALTGMVCLGFVVSFTRLFIKLSHLGRESPPLLLFGASQIFQYIFIYLNKSHLFDQTASSRANSLLFWSCGTLGLAFALVAINSLRTIVEQYSSNPQYNRSSTLFLQHRITNLISLLVLIILVDDIILIATLGPLHIVHYLNEYWLWKTIAWIVTSSIHCCVMVYFIRHYQFITKVSCRMLWHGVLFYQLGPCVYYRRS